MTLESKHTRIISGLLLVLALWDLALFGVAVFAPEFWIESIHGAALPDPMGLLPRTGAIWLAFAAFQLVAFLKWRTAPFWLCFVSGLRASELLADWTYLWFATSITATGRISLLLTPVLNLSISGYLLWAYFRVREEGRRA